MEFFDNVVNKSNALIKERLNNPFGQSKQGKQAVEQTVDQQQHRDSSADNSSLQQQQANTGDNIQAPSSSSASQDKDSNNQDQNAAEGDKNSQFAAIAADAEAVAQKAAKGAQKFGTFLFSMANKAGQTVSQTAKQMKQAVESTSILTDFTREQQEFLREHGGSMQAGELPWIVTVTDQGDSQQMTKVVDENLKEQILSLSQDKRNFVRLPPPNADYVFDAKRFYPIALSLLKEDPELSKMRYELVPKLVNEDTFWCNYFYRVEMLKSEADRGLLKAGGSQKRAGGWASSRSSSGEGPDEVTSSGGINQYGEPPSPGYATTTTGTDQENFSNTNSNSRLVMSGNTTGGELTSTALKQQQESLTTSVDQSQVYSINDEIDEASSSSDPRKVVAEADDLKNRLRELNIGSFDGSQDVDNEEDDDDEWDEELQREFELVSGDLSGLEEEEDLKNELLELEKSRMAEKAADVSGKKELSSATNSNSKSKTKNNNKKNNR